MFQLLKAIDKDVAAGERIEDDATYGLFWRTTQDHWEPYQIRVTVLARSNDLAQWVGIWNRNKTIRFKKSQLMK